MKKRLLVFSFFVVLLPAATQAQSYPIDRGSVIVGGSASLNSSSAGGDERLTSFVLSPDVQFFVQPGLAVGGVASFSWFNFGGESDARLFLGPAVSYYFGGPDQPLYPFVSGSFGFDVDAFEDSAQLTLQAGGAYMIARNVALTGAAFFSADVDDVGDQNVFGLRFGVRAFVF